MKSVQAITNTTDIENLISNNKTYEKQLKSEINDSFKTHYGVECTDFYFTKMFAYDNKTTDFYHPYIKPLEEK